MLILALPGAGGASRATITDVATSLDPTSFLAVMVQFFPAGVGFAGAVTDFDVSEGPAVAGEPTSHEMS